MRCLQNTEHQEKRHARALHAVGSESAPRPAPPLVALSECCRSTFHGSAHSWLSLAQPGEATIAPFMLAAPTRARARRSGVGSAEKASGAQVTSDFNLAPICGSRSIRLAKSAARGADSKPGAKPGACRVWESSPWQSPWQSLGNSPFVSYKGNGAFAVFQKKKIFQLKTKFFAVERSIC